MAPLAGPQGDLLESAAVVERVLEGEIETTVMPANALDVVAQQVVGQHLRPRGAADGQRLDQVAVTGRASA
jgi:Lhr-like helicase